MIKSRPSSGGRRIKSAEAGEYIQPPQERCPRCGGMHSASECPNPKISSRPIEQSGSDTGNKNDEKDKRKIDELRDRLKKMPTEDIMGYTTNATKVWLSGLADYDKNQLSDMENQLRIEREMRDQDIKSEQERMIEKYGARSPEINPVPTEKTRSFRIFKWLKKILNGE